MSDEEKCDICGFSWAADAHKKKIFIYFHCDTCEVFAQCFSLYFHFSAVTVAVTVVAFVTHFLLFWIYGSCMHFICCLYLCVKFNVLTKLCVCVFMRESYGSWRNKRRKLMSWWYCLSLLTYRWLTNWMNECYVT